MSQKITRTINNMVLSNLWLNTCTKTKKK